MIVDIQAYPSTVAVHDLLRTASRRPNEAAVRAWRSGRSAGDGHAGGMTAGR